MSYSSGEALVLTRVQAITGFSSANTSRGDWLVLNSGRSDRYAILRPGEFDTTWVASNSLRVRWTTVIEVWYRYTDDAATRTGLYGHVANIIGGLIAYPHMGGGTAIEDSTIEGAAEPEEMWMASGGPVWLRWQLRLRWFETIVVTFSG